MIQKNIICGIYRIRNIINNKSYIGQSIDIYHRWEDHLYALKGNYHFNKHLQNSWNKYGEKNFEFEIIAECDAEDLNNYEIYFIDKYQTANQEFGYNETFGGQYYSKATENTKKKRSESIKQHFIDHPEKRQEYRERTLKQFQNEEFYKNFLELRRSDEFREKLRLANIGRKRDPESVEKGASKLRKPILCVETGIIYNSTREANRAMPGNINVQSAALDIRKTAGGYHWRYV